MKTLVISVIIAFTFVINGLSSNRVNNFAYNTEIENGQVITQTVFKVENLSLIHI